jgi:hypothetical protein
VHPGQWPGNPKKVVKNDSNFPVVRPKSVRGLSFRFNMQKSQWVEFHPSALRSMKSIWITFKSSVPLSQETQCISILETNRYILFREIIAASYVNHTISVNAPFRQSTEFITVKDYSPYSYYYALEGYDRSLIRMKKFLSPLTNIADVCWATFVGLLTIWSVKLMSITFMHSLPTHKKIHGVITKISFVMLFREIITAYCENCKKCIA